MIRQAVLTSLCNLSGFATVGFLDSLEGETVTKVLMSQILLPNGLPKMVLLDADSLLFKHNLMVLLDELGVGFHVVSAEQHEGILCERYHRYLNKVQRLQGLDTKEYSNWMMNTSFAAYAWNGSPIDGTDIIRSFAAKARTFHFPLDVKEQLPRIIGNPGERALQHVETMFPLWFQQKELLQVLVQERRLRHTEWANKNKKRREFFPGDIVVVRRQIKSDASAGRPAKLRIKARGPYRVLEKAGEESYWIQRIPVLQELNRRPGVKQKQAAWRLERIPSSVVVHKRMDTCDTRWLQQHANLSDNPLEHNLGFFDFGRYHKAPDDAKYAFDKVGDLLGYDLDSDEEEDDDDDEGGNDDGQTDVKVSTDIPAPSDKDAQPSSPVNVDLPLPVPEKQEALVIDRGAVVDTQSPLTVAQRRKQLVEAVRASKDKLFLIFRLRPGYKLRSWHLVQVDEDETNWRKAKAEGVYHVRYYVKSFADSKKFKGRECAYWPEIHEFKRDGVTMGPIVPTKPGRKVEKLLNNKANRFMWYQDTINLFDCMLEGPFDFEAGHKVPQQVWKQLLSRASEFDLYVGAVNRVVPLGKPDREDRNNQGVAISHLAFRWNIFDGTK